MIFLGFAILLLWPVVIPGFNYRMCDKHDCISVEWFICPGIPLRKSPTFSSFCFLVVFFIIVEEKGIACIGHNDFELLSTAEKIMNEWSNYCKRILLAVSWMNRIGKQTKTTTKTWFKGTKDWTLEKNGFLKNKGRKKGPQGGVRKEKREQTVAWRRTIFLIWSRWTRDSCHCILT